MRVVSAISRIAISVADVNGHEVNAPWRCHLYSQTALHFDMYVLLIIFLVLVLLSFFVMQELP